MFRKEEKTRSTVLLLCSTAKENLSIFFNRPTKLLCSSRTTRVNMPVHGGGDSPRTSPCISRRATDRSGTRWPPGKRKRKETALLHHASVPHGGPEQWRFALQSTLAVPPLVEQPSERYEIQLLQPREQKMGRWRPAAPSCAPSKLLCMISVIVVSTSITGCFRHSGPIFLVRLTVRTVVYNGLGKLMTICGAEVCNSLPLFRTVGSKSLDLSMQKE